MQETWVQSLGQEDLLEKEMAPHSSILPGKSMDGGVWWVTLHGVAKSRTRLSDFTSLTTVITRNAFVIVKANMSVFKQFLCMVIRPAEIINKDMIE